MAGPQCIPCCIMQQTTDKSRVKRIIIIGIYPVYVSVVRRYVVMTCPYCPNKSPVVYMTGYPA